MIGDASEHISDWFWEIIARAGRDDTKLEQILRALSTDDLYRFALEFMHAANRVQYGPCTTYIQISEDGAADMSYWAVSQGKVLYQHILEHPDAITAFAEVGYRTLNFEFTAESLIRERVGDEAEDVLEEYERFVDSGYQRVADYWEVRRCER